MLILYHRNKLRTIFPKTSFSGELPLSDIGIDLLSKLLEMNPSQVLSNLIPFYLIRLTVN